MALVSARAPTPKIETIIRNKARIWTVEECLSCMVGTRFFVEEDRVGYVCPMVGFLKS